jgi:hypothetical protein
MIIKLFTKKDCPRCPAAKKVIEELQANGLQTTAKIEKYDVGTVDGMAEAAFYTVMATPSILVCDDGGKEIVGWRGEAPSLSAIRNSLLVKNDNK